MTDISVAGLTFDLPQYDMSPVGIEDVIRLLVKPLPRDLLLLLGELPDLFLFRAFGKGFRVAFETGS